MQNKTVPSNVIVLEMNKNNKNKHHEHAHKQQVVAEPVLCCKEHLCGVNEVTVPPIYCDMLNKHEIPAQELSNQNYQQKQFSLMDSEEPSITSTEISQYQAEPELPTMQTNGWTTDNNQRPSTAGNQRPSTAGNKRPTTAGSQRPTTAGNQRPSTAKDQKPFSKAKNTVSNQKKTPIKNKKTNSLTNVSNRDNTFNLSKSSRTGSSQSLRSVGSLSKPKVNNRKTRPPVTNKKINDSFEISAEEESQSHRSNLTPRRSNSFNRKNDAQFSNSLTADAFSSINPRRLSSGKIAFAYEDITEVVEELNKFPKYAVSGYRVLASETLSSSLKIDEEKIVSYESIFRKHLFLQIMLNYNQGLKYEMLDAKADCLKKIFREFAVEENMLKDQQMSLMIEAAEKSEKMLRNYYGERVELSSPLPDNKFGLSGIMDFFGSGKDRLDNRFNNIVMFKMSSEKFALSKYVLEIFLQGVILDIPTVFMLYYHAKESTLALYEFKFRYDKLRDYNKTLKIHQIFENFFKGGYGHTDCKINYKEGRDMDIQQRKY